METQFTPRNVAKYVVKAIVAGYTASIAETAITDYTRFEEDDFVVEISSHLVGWYVSDKFKPVSDRLVDKAADFIVEKRANRAAKKETP